MHQFCNSMRWNELRKVPNILTLSRLLSVPFLWVLALLGLRTPFAVLFTIAGLTDALDGFTARRLRQTSEFGKWFDSFADNVMSASLIFWLWLLLPDFFSEQLSVILIMSVLFLGSLVMGFIKYRKMVDYHLYSGKAAAIALYFFTVYALFLEPNKILFYASVVIIAVALSEETLLTLLNKEMQTKRTSILKK